MEMLQVQCIVAVALILVICFQRTCVYRTSVILYCAALVFVQGLTEQVEQGNWGPWKPKCVVNQACTRTIILQSRNCTDNGTCKTGCYQLYRSCFKTVCSDDNWQEDSWDVWKYNCVCGENFGYRERTCPTGNCDGCSADKIDCTQYRGVYTCKRPGGKPTDRPTHGKDKVEHVEYDYVLALAFGCLAVTGCFVAGFCDLGTKFNEDDEEFMDIPGDIHIEPMPAINA